MGKTSTIDAMNEHDEDQEINNHQSDDAAEEEVVDGATADTLDDQADETVAEEAPEELDNAIADEDVGDESGEDDGEGTEAIEETAPLDDALLSDELDIEAALASVVALDHALAEHTAAEIEEAERLQAEAGAIEQVNQALREEAERRAAYSLPRPPMIATIQRGQAASVIPALLLMAIGAWLTFSLTNTGESLHAGTVAIIAMGGLGLSMLAYWFTSRRWARGAFTTGLALLLCALVALFLSQSQDYGADGWPLFVIASAVTVLLSAFVSPRVGEGHVLSGLALAIAGGSALAVTTEVVSDEVLDVASTVSPAILVVVLIILLLPRIPKRPG